MRRVLLVLTCCAVLAACVTSRQPTGPAAAWDQRVSTLQHASTWTLDGRAAVAVGAQGWQANLNWQQRNDSTAVHLAGPFGVGALLLTRTPAGLSLNGAPPSAEVVAQIQDRLGFDLPMDHLRFWLLGVPDPSAAFDLKRNAQDRAAQLIQDAWTVDYDRYLPIAGDLLPAHVVLSRAGVRVRIVVDHWDLP